MKRGVKALMESTPRDQPWQRDVRWLKLSVKALKAFPSSPRQREYKAQMAAIENEYRNKNPRRKRNSRAVNRPGGYHAKWTLTATKKTGGRFYYAGGARLTTDLKDAIRFPSVIHATQVKDIILKDFPRSLTKNYLWLPSPAP